MRELYRHDYERINEARKRNRSNGSVLISLVNDDRSLVELLSY